jgi:hypothetical protein
MVNRPARELSAYRLPGPVETGFGSLFLPVLILDPRSEMTFEPASAGDQSQAQRSPSTSTDQHVLDVRTVHPLDWAIVGAGLLTLIFSFTSYYTYEMKQTCVTVGGAQVCGDGGNGGDWNAFHGYFGWIAMVLALTGSVAVALALLVRPARPSGTIRLIGVIDYALATVSVVIALFLIPDPFGIRGFNKGHGYGYWISLILIIAGLVMSLMRWQATGGDQQS